MWTTTAMRRKKLPTKKNHAKYPETNAQSRRRPPSRLYPPATPLPTPIRPAYFLFRPVPLGATPALSRSPSPSPKLTNLNLAIVPGVTAPRPCFAGDGESTAPAP